MQRVIEAFSGHMLTSKCPSSFSMGETKTLTFTAELLTKPNADSKLTKVTKMLTESSADQTKHLGPELQCLLKIKEDLS